MPSPRRFGGALAAATLAGGLLAASSATAGSLYSGPGPRPGPALLYAPLAVAPQLQNSPGSVWLAQPILISCAVAFHRGQFVYQGFLYDNHTPHNPPPPNNHPIHPSPSP